MLELNKIYCQDNVQGMKMLDDESIDLIEKHDNESWADIEIFKGRYQASTLGRIRSVARTYKGRIIPTKPRVLKPIIDRYGYEKIMVDRKIYSIHRLVATTFIPNPENKPYIDHIDASKRNNHVENLRWVTPLENNLNPLTRIKYQESQPVYEILNGNIINKWNSTKEVAKELGVSRSAVTMVLCGIHKTCKGRKFIYG